MKILITNIKKEGGGAEKSIDNLIKFAKKNNIEIKLITLDYFKKKHSSRMISWIYYFLAIYRKSREGFKIISGIEGLNFIVTKIAAFRSEFTVIQWIHCNPIDYMKFQNKKNKIAIIISIKVSSKNIVASPYYSKIFNNCIFIPNFIDNSSEITRKSEELSGLIFVGSLNTLKRPDLAIKVAKLFPEFNLNIYGEGPLYFAIENYVKNNFLAEQIKLMGFVNDPWKSIGTRKILLLPSETEALPMVIVEAINNGCAVISSNFNGAEFFYQRDGLVKIINFKNDSEIIDAINEIKVWNNNEWIDRESISKNYFSKIFDNSINLSKLISYI